MLKSLFSDANTVFGVCAFVLSLISIYIAYKAVKIQKEHNIKSVRPIAQISPGDYEDDIFIRLENNGIGPMIILEIKIYQNKEHISNSVIDAIPEDISKEINWTDFISDINDKALALKEGEKIHLIKSSFHPTGLVPDNTFENRKKLRFFLKDLTVECVYTDIYENEYKINQSMSWFGRHF